MYIPSLFSSNPNGCPNGYNAYPVGNWHIVNLNSGARSKITTNYNTMTFDVIGSNFAGSGSYVGNIELNNGASTDLIYALTYPQNPSYSPLSSVPTFAYGSMDNTLNFNYTTLTGEQLYYCYDCTRKFRWTFGSKYGLPSPWPGGPTTPATFAYLTNPGTDAGNPSNYSNYTLNFNYTQTGSIVGYGPLWQAQGSGTGNAAEYYVISREDITPYFYTIQNCSNEIATATISLSGSSETQKLSVGNVLTSNLSGLTGSCWNVTNVFQSASYTPTYSNVVTSSINIDCTSCLAYIAQKYNIINCSTSQSYVATFTNTPTIGQTFKSNASPIGCYTISSLASSSATPDYTNLTTLETYSDCSTCLATSSSLAINYLIVGGGGAGGGYAGGGGGAGQFISASTTLLTGSSYSVTVGQGGTAAGFKGTNGNSSSFNSIVAIGGGAGGAANSGVPAAANGNSGSSGGGGSYYLNGTGGTGTAGNNGGTGNDGGSSASNSGGGGGASQIGAGGSTTSIGGNGTLWIDGNYYAGGGGGFRVNTTLSSNGTGGLGGGGNGFLQQYPGGATLRASSSGSVNTGGGGGGAQLGISSPGTWSGGSGVVKIRYYGNTPAATGGIITSGSGTITHTFTSGSNTFTIT